MVLTIDNTRLFQNPLNPPQIKKNRAHSGVAVPYFPTHPEAVNISDAAVNHSETGA